MYEYIKGSVAELTPTGAVIEAGGVGYYLHISLQTFSEIEHASEARLWVHYLVREDAQLFYGFATRAERELFRLLLSVSGVGGNTARMILSTYSPRELQSIIATENAVLLKSVKGLGLKTAQKIIVELSGKMAAAGLAPDEAPKAAAGSEAYDEALAALVMLGFARAAADKAVTAVLKEEPALSVEETVRRAAPCDAASGCRRRAAGVPAGCSGAPARGCGLRRRKSAYGFRMSVILHIFVRR